MAYAERLRALDRVAPAGDPPTATDPAALAEWALATLEEPLVRAEVVGEVLLGVEQLDGLAKEHGRPVAEVAAELREISAAGGLRGPFRDDDDPVPLLLERPRAARPAVRGVRARAVPRRRGGPAAQLLIAARRHPRG